MAPLYAIGALDAVTAHAFKRRIENADPESRREIEAELEAWTETAAQLPLGLDPASPDPALKAELMRRITRETQARGTDYYRIAQTLVRGPSRCGISCRWRQP